MEDKIIGIILRQFNSTFRNLPLYGIKEDIIHCLSKYNVNVVCIPVYFENKSEFKRIKKTIDLCDGIIFPGGIGIEDIDLEIVRYLYKEDKPTLGICLGMQIMGKAFDGEVRCNGALKEHDSSDVYAHDVEINKESKLFEIIGNSKIKVNSKHKDCLTCTNLNCVAASNNIIEAIEDKNKKFFLGVQWHPESILEDENSNKLITYFVNSL